MGTLETHSTALEMQATLREYMGTEERDRRSLALDQTLITIGRSELCTYTIGKTLGSLALGISKIQATITSNETQLTLQDGGADGVSTNGIYCHGEKVDRSIVLVSGLELTLFKHGLAKVVLVISDHEPLADGKDTYTGQDLLSLMQEQVLALTGQIEALHEQVTLLGGQITQREAIDSNQEERLVQAEKRLNRVMATLLATIAAIVLAFGWLGGNNEDKKQWSSTLTSIVIGVAALYIQTQKQPVAIK